MAGECKLESRGSRWQLAVATMQVTHVGRRKTSELVRHAGVREPCKLARGWAARESKAKGLG